MSNSGQATSHKVIFFGNEQIATGIHTDAPILRALLAAGHTILAIVLSDAGTRSRTKQKPAVMQIAEEYAIAVLTPTSLRAIREDLTALRPDIGVLAAYGKLVPRDIIEDFPHGIINVHPSLLPKHRGSMPIESAILAGEVETGVSIMQLAPEMDAGPIYAQAVVETADKTKQMLTDELAELGAIMISELLPAICAGTVIAAPQDDAAATYDGRITKDKRDLDPSKPALQLEREVKAHAGWPGSKLTIAGKECIITTAHAIENTLDNVDKKTIFVSNKLLCLQTSDGILVIDELKPAGKATMSASAFIAGHKQLL